ncbi:MAG: flagellar hook capping FlgD N-terminal domain-containing protein [Bacillota bacterium]
MTVGAVTGGPGGTYNSSKESRVENRAMDMGTETFLKLLVTQMRYQDPFSGGQDMGDFMSQIAQFTMLERLIKLQQTVENFAAQQGPAQSLHLLNRMVEVKDEYGQLQWGEVTAIRFADGKPLLRVNGKEFSLQALQRVEGDRD